MKFTLEWKPVIEALDLGAYNPAFKGQSIPVCVNPPQEFMDERAEIMREFSERFDEYAKAQTRLTSNDEKKVESAQELIKAFQDWSEGHFTPAVHDWYARLFSYDGDIYSAADLTEYGRVDVHFLNWLMQRAIEMINEHRSGRKKNSMTR